MPPMGPPGRRNDFKKPKNAKKTFTRILKYMGKNKLFIKLHNRANQLGIATITSLDTANAVADIIASLRFQAELPGF